MSDTHKRGQHDSADKLTLKDVSRHMRKQDIAMVSTRHGDDVATRPMSNNRDVDFDGDTYFFTTADTTTVADIKAHPRVGVSYQDVDDDVFIALSGAAELHTDRETLEPHWRDEFKQWFPDGLETEGLTLVAVKAERVHYWIGRKEDELVLD